MRRRVELVLHPRAQRAGRRHATAIAEPAAVVEQPVAADQGAARQTSRMAWVAGGGRRAGVLHLRRRRQLPQKRVGGSMTTPENVGSRTASNVSLLSLSAPEILQRPAPQPGAPLFGAPRPECPSAPPTLLFGGFPRHRLAGDAECPTSHGQQLVDALTRNLHYIQTAS